MLVLVGPQDAATLPALESGLAAAYESPARALVVDLAQVPVIDVVATCALVDASRALHRAARDLLVINVQPWVTRLLRRHDPDGELRLVTVERLLSPAWREAGALRPLAERV